MLGDGDEGHTSPKIFCQMDFLHKLADAFQWRETARYVQFDSDHVCRTFNLTPPCGLFDE